LISVIEYSHFPARMLPLWAQLAGRRWCFCCGSNHRASYDSL